MPSKNRKHSKTPLKLSYLDQSSPSQGSSSSRPPLEPEINEEDISRSLLEEASVRYPYLISKDAFIGRITDVDSNYGSHAAKIWLSESAMVASSLVPGSIVSVSLASSKMKLLGGSPLDSLIEKCGWHYNIDVLDDGTNDVGGYFALALAFPSCKVLKNGLRLSWSLACTLGNPSIGKITFVFPIRTHSMTGFLNGSNKLHYSSINSDSRLSFCNCKNLYLQLVPSKNGVLVNGDLTSEGHHDQLENGKSPSPKTPLLYNSKLNSPGVSNTIRSRDSVSNIQYSNETLFFNYDVEEALGNEKSRELLQTCVALWSRTRFLLCGNLLAIPMGGQTSVFLVQGADELSIECPSEESVNDGKCVLSHSAQTFDLDHTNIAFFMDYETKVHINSPLPGSTQTPDRRGMPPVEPDCGDIKDKEADHVLKLGGLSKEYTILKDIIIESSVKGFLSSLGIRPTKGALLYGPPGTGKTSLARSCVIDAGRNLFSINGPEIIGQFHGESEQTLREIFETASKASPAVVFIDELDAIAPARKDGGDELSQRLVATLLNLMDGISSTDGILVIAATNRLDSIDPALRRPGRLEREIEIGVPSPKQRLDILHSLLNEMDHALVGTQIQDLASNTHGFVGADLASLCNEAALVCLRRYVSLKNSHYSSSATNHSVQLREPHTKCDGCSDYLMGSSALSSVNRHNDTESVSLSFSDHTVSSETAQSCYSVPETQQKLVTPQNVDHIISDMVDFELEKEGALKVTFGDFEKAKRKVRPSAMREVILEIPKVRWEDVGGQKEVKKQLMEAVEWPQKHIDAFERIGTRPPTGVLMLGPPGCSKTLMARAVASEAGVNFLSVKGPELFSKWVGESEKAVKSLFAKARDNAPSIIFFDEIDGLAVIRGKENGGASVSDRVMSQLLVELDGLHQRVDVTVIAATNRPDKIDPALLRPGRFDRLLYVGPPDEADREDIFNIHARRMACSSNVNIKELAHLTDGCTGADISLICREAGNAAIEESRDASEVSMAHFKIGLGRVQPSLVHPSTVGYYRDFYTKFQRLVSSSAAVDVTGCTPSSIASSRFGIRMLLKSLSLMLFRPSASKASS